MAIIWERIKNLKLRNKLSLIYTVSFNLMLGITFIVIYYIAEKERDDAFNRHLSDRTMSTFRIAIQVDEIDNKMLRLFDDNTINRMSDEVVLLYDSVGRLLYSSNDSGHIKDHEQILQVLRDGEELYDGEEGKYELLGQKFFNKKHAYYGIAKAYDKTGKAKMHFLAILLVTTFIIVALLIIIISYLLSGLITRPITNLANDVGKISPYDLSKRIYSTFSEDEIGFLAGKFNELLEKLESVFKFQHNYINHLSHELKTPLAVMMADAERALVENEYSKLVSSMQFQKDGIMELSHIINAMLDISKMENKLAVINAESIRIDEIIFECIDELTILNPRAGFEFYFDDNVDEGNLTVAGSSRMIKMAVMNLVRNAVNFSDNDRPNIEMTASAGEVHIKIINDGGLLEPDEQEKLFTHSFRGKNSHLVKGFGLGLMITYRIVKMHNGGLVYSTTSDGKNRFTLSLPAGY